MDFSTPEVRNGPNGTFILMSQVDLETVKQNIKIQQGLNIENEVDTGNARTGDPVNNVFFFQATTLCGTTETQAPGATRSTLASKSST
jgi:hypothetical protein